MRIKISEKDFFKNSYNLFCNNADVSFISTEVPILGRYADLVYIKSKHIYAVEFKINNCKKALLQSKDHMLGADYCYICMPERKFKESFIKELQNLGIGLLTIAPDTNKKIKEVIKARKSKKKFQFVWKNTLNHCMKNPNLALNVN